MTPQQIKKRIHELKNIIYRSEKEIARLEAKREHLTTEPVIASEWMTTKEIDSIDFSMNKAETTMNDPWEKNKEDCAGQGWGETGWYNSVTGNAPKTSEYEQSVITEMPAQFPELEGQPAVHQNDTYKSKRLLAWKEYKATTEHSRMTWTDWVLDYDQKYNKDNAVSWQNHKSKDLELHHRLKNSPTTNKGETSILSAIGTDRLSVAAIVAHTGYTAPTVRNYLNRLKNKGYILSSREWGYDYHSDKYGSRNVWYITRR